MKKAILLLLSIVCLTTQIAWAADFDEPAKVLSTEDDPSYLITSTVSEQNNNTTAEAVSAFSLQQAIIHHPHTHHFSFLIFLNTIIFCILILVITAKKAKWF
ncbi:MAG: hypothetical protein HFE77_04385 [Clostridiales bacterium]|nr:hypothetical protein [Clostridiales bacterium]